jgi:hypothetical protein
VITGFCLLYGIPRNPGKGRSPPGSASRTFLPGRSTGTWTQVSPLTRPGPMPSRERRLS